MLLAALAALSLRDTSRSSFPCSFLALMPGPGRAKADKRLAEPWDVFCFQTETGEVTLYVDLLTREHARIGPF